MGVEACSDTLQGAILCRNCVGMGVCTLACAQQINHLSTYA